MQPPAELVERFRTDCRALWPAEDGGRLTLAVSGGPDSLALLLLAQVIDQQIAGDTEQEGARVLQRGTAVGALQTPQAQVDLLAEVGGQLRRADTAMEIAGDLRGVLLEQVVGAHGIARLSNVIDNDS